VLLRLAVGACGERVRRGGGRDERVFNGFETQGGVMRILRTCCREMVREVIGCGAGV